MRSLSLSILTLCLFVAAPVIGQVVAVLPIDFGEGTYEGLVEVREALDAISGVTVVSPEMVQERVAARYGEPVGVDAVWIEVRVQQSEDAYYTMQFDSAVAVLTGEQWDLALDAVVDMALNPDLAANVHRGLMTLARSYFYAEQMAEADGAILQSLHRFPDRVATTELYQPEFVEHFNEIREEFLLGTSALSIDAPGALCVRLLNGMDIGQGEDVQAMVRDGVMAVRVSCGRTPSRTHLLDVAEATSLYIDPSFDWTFRQASGVLALDVDGDELFETLPRMARAWGDVVGVTRVIAVGVTGDDELQIVDLAEPEETVLGAVRAERQPDGSFPVRDAVDALFSGQPSAGVAVADEGDWQEVMGADSQGEGIGAATWVSFAIGGAGLITGLAFAIVESNRWDDFDSCKADPLCANSSALEDDRSDAERAGVVASVGFGVGIAALVTGVVLLAVDIHSDRRARERADDDWSESSAWLPTVRGDVGRNGGGVLLDWQF